MTTKLHIYDSDNADDDNDPGDELYLERFRRRRDTPSLSKQKIMQSTPYKSHHGRQKKKVEDDPVQWAVTSILDSLSRPHYHTPYFGYKMLYQGSTPNWQEVLRKSVGASEDTDETFLLTALSASMERPHNNQFGILVGVADEDDNERQKYLSNDDAMYISKDDCRHYKLEFPRDTLDYYDGTAWVECRLRDVHSDALLVVIGWSMKQHGRSSAWKIDSIDWQDFRDKYRPGIGREEWERICG